MNRTTSIQLSDHRSRTWAATLLQSSGVAYRYGVSGPFWYASGATVQILLFATLAIELKRKAPNAHTFLEVIRARYGVYTHVVYIVFGLMTNILVTAMLLTGGSAVVTSLTGMPTAAACFLLPVGVVLYTVFGGIKATFLTDYVHTVSSPHGFYSLRGFRWLAHCGMFQASPLSSHSQSLTQVLLAGHDPYNYPNLRLHRLHNKREPRQSFQSI